MSTAEVSMSVLPGNNTNNGRADMRAFKDTAVPLGRTCFMETLIHVDKMHLVALERIRKLAAAQTSVGRDASVSCNTPMK